MVETTLVLLVFLATIIGALDFGQLLFTHQVMVERVRGALRWGVVQPWDGSGNGIKNMVLYNQPTAPVGINQAPFMGLAPRNIDVQYTAPTSANPNDEKLTVAIVDYEYRFFSPWIAKTFTNRYAVVQSAAMSYKP